MDYFRNSFAKDIDSIVTLYDIRHAYNKNKTLLHTDEGLKQKFSKRIIALKEKSSCVLMNACVEEILECLDDANVVVAPRFLERSPPREKKVNLLKVKPKHTKSAGRNLELFFLELTYNGKAVLEEMILEVVKRTLEYNHHNLSKTASQLGISPRTLRSKLYDIKKKESIYASRDISPRNAEPETVTDMPDTDN
jgi:DNA-binding protein Fis